MQVLRIEQYVDMVLHYIKIDHMASDLRLRRYQLNDIVNDVVKKQATFFYSKEIKITI